MKRCKFIGVSFSMILFGHQLFSFVAGCLRPHAEPAIFMYASLAFHGIRLEFCHAFCPTGTSISKSSYPICDQSAT